MSNFGDSRRSGNREAQKFVPVSDWTQDDEASYLFLDLPGFRKEQLRLQIASTGHIIIGGERTVNENKSIYFEQTFKLPENSDTEKISGKFDGDFLHVTVPKKVAEENEQQDISSRNENHAKNFGETSVRKEPNNNDENQSKHEDEHDDHHEQQLHKHEDKHDDHHEQQLHGGEAAAKGEMTSKEVCRVASFPKEMLKKWEQEDGPLEMAMKFLNENKGVVVSVVIAFAIGVLVCRTFESSGK